MIWKSVIGNREIRENLKNSVVEKRLSHAQLFSGKNGWGTLNMALAYIAEILAADKSEASAKKVLSLQHPDVHFSFPVISDDKRKNPTSNMFIREWREFILQQPYGSLYDWLEFLEVPKKTGIINVHEAAEINQFLSLNSYEGSYKFCVIWQAEMLNSGAANKLLKSIEEPPDKTIFILITEREDLLLPTIISRCQTVNFNKLTDDEITQYLVDKGFDEQKSVKTAVSSNGDLREALLLVNASNEEFEDRFIEWVRNAFMAKTNPAVLKDLIKWSEELSAWPREKQKQFFIYCSETFRQALLQNYNAGSLVYMKPDANGFKWEKFSSYIHGGNIELLLKEINNAAYHIERNANPKIVLLDLSILMTRHLHTQIV